MIAARRVRCHVRDELVPCSQVSEAGFDHRRVGPLSALRVVPCSRANGFHKTSADIGYKAGQRPWGGGHMKDRLVLEKIPAHHIHVDVDAETAADFGMTGEIRHCALDLGSPDEAQSSPRPAQDATGD